MIGIAKPERFFAPWEFVDSLLSLKGEYEIVTSSGSLIEENRNELFQKAKGKDYLLMVDTDMVFTKKDVDTLIARINEGYDIVCGLFFIGHAPYWPALYNHLSPTQKVIQPPTDLRQVAGCGMAFTIISKKVLETLESRPFDRLVIDNKLFGEDLSFCLRAEKAGFKIYCDPQVKIGHLRTHTI